MRGTSGLRMGLNLSIYSNKFVFFPIHFYEIKHVVYEIQLLK